MKRSMHSVCAEHRPMLLAVDKGGRPSEWINWRDAVKHYVSGDVMWTVGNPAFTLFGGHNSVGERSMIDVHPVICINGADASVFEDYVIPLTNRALFARDKYLCLYCGEKYPKSLLTRDHVFPQGRNGPDVWTNVVTACKACNETKGCRTPSEAGMELLATPFAPSHIEGLILSNRNILADQMAFLEAQRPNLRR